jgi:hypothetical protein
MPNFSIKSQGKPLLLEEHHQEKAQLQGIKPHSEALS